MDEFFRRLRGMALALAVIGAPTATAQSVEPGAGAKRAYGAVNVTMRRDTPSGFPVPRFVSLSGQKTNCRQGPSKSHPIRFIFSQRGEPVLVVAATPDHWRKIRDMAGDECWAFHTTLTAQTHLRAHSEVRLFARRDPTSPVRATLGKGVLAPVDRRQTDDVDREWVLISVNGAKGWALAADFWGGDPMAAFAAHNAALD